MYLEQYILRSGGTTPKVSSSTVAPIVTPAVLVSEVLRVSSSDSVAIWSTYDPITARHS